MSRACSTKWKKIYAYGILVRKLEGMRQIEGSRSMLENNIRLDLREIGWVVVDRIKLSQNKDRLRSFVNTLTNLRIP